MTQTPPDGRGLADLPAAELGPVVLGAWDDFLALAAEVDLAAPTRLKGWTAHDVLVHLGSWPEHDAVAALLASVGTSTRTAHVDADQTNTAVVSAHRAASRDEVLAALHLARASVAAYFSERHDEVGHEIGQSVLGPLPVATVVHAVCYELAVHALDLRPAEEVPFSLLSPGLAALADTTGALSARHSITIEVSAMAPEGGWAFASSRTGWATRELPAGRFNGIGIEGSAAHILEASAGRTHAVPLLVSRKLVVHKLPLMLGLAPLIDEVPGIPGGPALKGAIKHLAGAGRLLGKLPGFRR